MGRGIVIIAGLAVAATIGLALWVMAPDQAQPLVMPSPLTGDSPGGGTPRLGMQPERVEAPAPAGVSWSLVGRRSLAGVGRSPVPAPAGPLEPPPAAQLARLLDDLRDDDVRWNAGKAMSQLRRYLERSPAREVVAEALTGALDSTDLQQRYFSAQVLMRAELESPPDRLLAVVIDMMADGELEGAPWAMRQIRRNLFTPQTASIDYMIEHADVAEQRLLGLLGHQRQEEARFLAAFVLASTGHPEHTDRLAPVLISHLADNDWPRDAVMSMIGLMALDRERVIWWLRVSSKPDEQFQRSKRLLLYALRHEGVVPKEMNKRDNVVAPGRSNFVGLWRFHSYAGRGK